MGENDFSMNDLIIYQGPQTHNGVRPSADKNVRVMYGN